MGLGIDLVSIHDVEDSIRTHGKRYLDRIYTPAELAECGLEAHRLAARFAAKEAAMKALGRAEEAVAWTSIEVRSDSAGRPTLALSGTAAVLARDRNVATLSVSLTHEPPLAAAVVVAAGSQ
jgi:holo-[acyl-carrier protein] synthase